MLQAYLQRKGDSFRKTRYSTSDIYDSQYIVSPLNDDLEQINAMKFEEKRLRTILLKSKEKQKDNMKSLHLNTLRESLLSNTNLYLTETQPLKVDVTTPVQSVKLKELFRRFHMNETKFNTNLQNEKLINRITSNFSKIKNEPVSDFTRKALEKVKTNFCIDMKRERTNQLEETYNNKIEKLKDAISSIKTADDLSQSYMTKFERYVRHLCNQKERESQELYRITEAKNKIDLENKKLVAQINHLKQNLTVYLDYRNFLVCVKERKTELPEHFKSRQDFVPIQPKNNNVRRESKTNQTLKNQIPSPGRRKSTNPLRRSGSLIVSASSLPNLSLTPAEHVIVQELDHYSRYLIKPIFNNAEELIEEFKKLEKDNMVLLETYNRSNKILRDLSREFSVVNTDETVKDNKFTELISEKETKLKDLKDRNRKLHAEIARLQMPSHKDHLITSRSLNNQLRTTHKKSSSFGGFISSLALANLSNIRSQSRNKMHSEILRIYNCINEHCPIEERVIVIPGDKVPISLEFNMINMLKEIENIVIVMLEKHNYYKVNRGKELKNIRDALEKERKANKANEQKVQDLKKREQLKKDIYEKSNKLYIIPKRKVAERFKPAEHKQKKQKDFTKEKDYFEDMIAFEDCF